MTTKAVQKITFQEYLSYDNGTDNRYEFIDGELVLMPSPSPLHEDIAHFLLVFFYQEIQRLGMDWIARVTNTGVRTIASRASLNIGL